MIARCADYPYRKRIQVPSPLSSPLFPRIRSSLRHGYSIYSRGSAFVSWPGSMTATRQGSNIGGRDRLRNSEFTTDFGFWLFLPICIQDTDLSQSPARVVASSTTPTQINTTSPRHPRTRASRRLSRSKTRQAQSKHSALVAPLPFFLSYH